MSKYHIPLLPDNIYHLFSRAVGSEKLFVTAENYRFFLQKLQLHILSVADVWAYSLLPNHFHLVVQIKSATTIAKFYEARKNKKVDALTDLPDFIMEQFSNWLNSYTKSFNKVYNRKGGLFMDYLKRSVVQKDGDLTSFIYYVHKNAVHHGLAKKIGEWRYDSYNIILNQKQSFVNPDFVINWFGSRESFQRFHERALS